MNHRVFLAIDIPQNIISAIQKKQQEMKLHAPPIIRWTKPNLLHITLKFEGELKQADLEPLCHDLHHAFFSFNPFTLEYQTLGVFPDLRKPRILWLGITHNDALFYLVRTVESIFNTLGYRPENRPFQAHLTIGRFNNHLSQSEIQDFSACLESQKDKFHAQQTVDHVTLYESTLTSSGPIYKTILQVPFKSAGT